MSMRRSGTTLCQCDQLELEALPNTLARAPSVRSELSSLLAHLYRF